MICVALIRFVVFPQKTSTSAYPRDPDPVGASEGFLRLVNLLVQQMLDKSWMLDLLIGMVSFNVFLRCFFFVFNMSCGGGSPCKSAKPHFGDYILFHTKEVLNDIKCCCTLFMLHPERLIWFSPNSPEK